MDVTTTQPRVRMDDPEGYRTQRRHVISLPGPKTTRRVVRTTTTPAENARLFAKVEPDGVHLWSTMITAEEFILSFDDGTRPGDLVQIAVSRTPWLAGSPFVHTTPPYGDESVTYYLHVRRDGKRLLVGRFFIDLANYRLDAPVIDEVNSHYNIPYIHIEWSWPGNPADLDHFVVFAQHPSGQEFIVQATDENEIHIEIQGPHEPTIFVTIEAVGKVLADARSLVAVLADGAATGGDDGDPDAIGDDRLRSNFDHRLVTPNLALNSSFEQLEGEDPKHWIYVGGLLSPVTDAEWSGRHGNYHAAIASGETLEQAVGVRLANTDIFSMSLVAKTTSGTIRLTTASGIVIHEQLIFEGINVIQGFRIPPTDDRFILKVIGTATFDMVQVNQGSTVDPWAFFVIDRLYDDLATTEDLIQGELDDILQQFADVFALMGGVSGSTVLTLPDAILVIVAALTDSGNGTFGRLVVLENSFALNTAAIATHDDQISAVEAGVSGNQSIITDPKTGNLALDAGLQFVTNAILNSETGLAAAHAAIALNASVITGPDGNTTLRADLAAAIVSYQAGIGAANAAIAANTAIITGADGNAELRSDLNINTQAIADLGDDLAAAETSISAHNSIITNPTSGNAALLAALSATASTVAQQGVDINSAQSSIALHTSQISGINGDISAIEATAVLKVQTTVGGKARVASVALSASGLGGSALVLTADSIDMNGVVNFINGGGTSTIDGDRISTNSMSLDRLSGTGVLNMGGWILSEGSGLYYISGQVQMDQTGFHVGNSGFTSNLLDTPAVTTNDLTVGSTTIDQFTGISSPLIACTTTLTVGIVTIGQSSIAVTGSGYWNASGINLDRVECDELWVDGNQIDPGSFSSATTPEEVETTIDLSSTTDGVYEKTVTITGRPNADFNVTPYQATVHVGDIEPVSLPVIPVYVPIIITGKTSNSFTFTVKKHQTTTPNNAHTLKFWIS